MSRLKCFFLCLSVAFVATGAAAEAPDHAQGVRNLESDTRGQAMVRVDDAGKARFVRLPEKSLPRLGGRSSTDKARNFFRRYGDAFGVADADRELIAVRSFRDSSGMEHVVFQQSYRGTPVFGGDLRAHFSKGGDLVAVNGVFVDSLKISTEPNLTVEVASQIAIRKVFSGLQKEKRASLSAEDAPITGSDESELAELSAASVRLVVFNTGLVRGTFGTNHLAFEVEVVNAGPSIREFVYVDAHSGKVIDQITGIYDAKFRRAFDAAGAPHPGPNYPASPFWVEGDSFPTGNVEADNMILASGETYDLFSDAFGRDSFDGAGATMDAIFNRGDSCPNASWNGIYISFCPGLTTDDVTAHEWGHAYTQYTNNLIYQWQSGALNESYSDIWGETVDLINGRGLDAPGGPRSGCAPGDGTGDVRWMMGEEVNAPGLVGALRDMWDPTCFGSPGKVTDTEYICSSFDNGGVHFNSGVNNHAYALLVDGGSYNGQTISAIGLTKAAHIFWGAQNLLGPASSFADQADALETACSALIGVNLADLVGGAPSGEIIGAPDCQEVTDAIAAVEFRTFPDQCGFETILDPDAPALCEGLGTVQTVAFEDFEGGSLPAGWTVSSHDVVNPGTFDNPGWDVVGSLPAGANGSYAAFAPDLNEGDCSADIEAGAVAIDSPVISLPVGEVPHVAFDHWVATEAGWDGGNVKLSVNGSPWSVIPSAAYSFNPYNGTIIVSDNPLGGEDGFTGSNEGVIGGSWGQSQINLYGLAFPGDDIQLRFDLGVDGCAGLVGWYVDDVHTYSCSDEEPPICGDGALDLGEQCDDGNMSDGDGCSSVCVVEDGWVCNDPVPPGTGSNVIADYSFESGNPAGDWTATSTFGGISGFPLCGPGNGCPAAALARTGSWLVWIGGLASGVTSDVEQTVIIPPTATELTLYSLRGICDDPSDTLHVSLDGIDIGTVVCDGTDGDWVQQTFSVAGYNDGGTHVLNIGGTVGGTNGGHSNFFVEDVVLEDNLATPGAPSECFPLTEDAGCDQVVDYATGIPGVWSVVDDAGLGLVWSNIAGAGEAGNYTGGAGDAATVSSDAYGPADFDTSLISNSFSLANASSATLEYLVNYQNFAAFDFLDVDISIDGGSSWTNLLSWNEDHGTFRGVPGEAVSLDLGAYVGESDVMLRWRYYDPTTFDWDWYAQVDNVGLSCNLIPDCDGAVATPDLLWPPNHKFWPISIEVSDPDGDPVTVTVDSIYQDEPLGNNAPDGKGVGTSTAEVRSERLGMGNGKVYYISFTADDGNGGVCSGVVEVGVGHDQGAHSMPIGDGPLYDSTGN